MVWRLGNWQFSIEIKAIPNEELLALNFLNKASGKSSCILPVSDLAPPTLIQILTFLEIWIKAWMKVILAVMSTTWAVHSTSLSTVQIYGFYIFLAIYSSLHGFIWNQLNDQLPVGLLAQLVEPCTGIAEVMGSNPVQAWIFSGLIFTTAQVVHITARITFIHVFIRSSNIWLSYILSCLIWI